MERVEGHVVTSAVPAALDTPRGPPAHRRGARRRARRDPRRRLARRRASRASASRPATSSASCGASSACGSTTARARSRPSSRVGAWLEDEPARVRPGDRRPRRLPPGQHDVRAATRPRGSWRSSTGRWRRSATRWPTSATCARCGSIATTRRGGMFELSGVTREEGFPLREELVARYEERSGRSMTDIRWYRTLALWKSIVFMEGNYKRALSRRHRRPLPQGLRRRRHPARRSARRRWPVAAERSAVLLDWGGVMTSDLFGSFARLLRARRASTPTSWRNLFRHDRDARGAAHRLRVRAHRGGRLRAAPGATALGLGVARGPHRPPLRRRRRSTRRWSTACARCTSRGVATGLVSNSWGTRRYPRDLLAELFDGIVISGEEGFRKPDPRMYELGAQRIGAGPQPSACSSTTWPSTSTRRASSGWRWCITRRRLRRWRSSSGCWA